MISHCNRSKQEQLLNSEQQTLRTLQAIDNILTTAQVTLQQTNKHYTHCTALPRRRQQTVIVSCQFP